MKLSVFKKHLQEMDSLHFIQPDGTEVPVHFHITEAGITTRHFVDCGGSIRLEDNINMQIWVAGDTEHRLAPAKLLKILAIADPLFQRQDLEIEMEYQGETIGRYGLEADGNKFRLTPKFTNCLAKDKCGIPEEKIKYNLKDLKPVEAAACCKPGSGCC